MVFSDVRFLLCFNGEAAGLHSADISGTIITDGCLVLSTQRRSGDETRALPAHGGMLVKPGDKLYLYGDSFNSDSVIFYRDGPIDTLTQPAEIISNKIGAGDEYVIMSQNEWRKISDLNPNLPAPLLKSEGTGPEGDAPLVLFKGRVALIVRVFWELISSVQKDKIGTW